jgi:hypothetical protein
MMENVNVNVLHRDFRVFPIPNLPFNINGGE